MNEKHCMHYSLISLSSACRHTDERTHKGRGGVATVKTSSLKKEIKIITNRGHKC